METIRQEPTHLLVQSSIRLILQNILHSFDILFAQVAFLANRKELSNETILIHLLNRFQLLPQSWQ